MNFRASLRQSTSRRAVWLFAVAMLLKAAMPMLASASAEMQGKTQVEVCTVYGVSLVALDGKTAHEPAREHSPETGGAHDENRCALTGLIAFSAPEPQALVIGPAIFAAALPPLARPSSQAPDACAAWVARLKHGPPTLS